MPRFTMQNLFFVCYSCCYFVICLIVLIIILILNNLEKMFFKNLICIKMITSYKIVQSY